jgi:hypothetical protein
VRSSASGDVMTLSFLHESQTATSSSKKEYRTMRAKVLKIGHLITHKLSIGVSEMKNCVMIQMREA